MSGAKQGFSVKVEGMKAVCPLGEVVGNEMIAERRIPVISCEGGCFRGEIARVAAHMVAEEEPYSRGCHGEMFTAPRSAMAEWARKADSLSFMQKTRKEYYEEINTTANSPIDCGPCPHRCKLWRR